MVALSADDWINVLKNVTRSELEKCQLVCRWLYLIIEQHSKNLPFHYLSRCVVYGMLENDKWDWKENDLCGDYAVSKPNEFYVIRCQKATHPHKQCPGYKATPETLALELRRNLRTTHACKFIFRRLTVTCAVLNALESVFVDVMECKAFQTLKFDKCAIDDEILEKPTILDKYRIAKHMYFYVQSDDYTRLTPLIHKKAVQLADEIATFQLEPIEVVNFALGINYEVLYENYDFRGLSVSYVPVDDYMVETVLGSLLNIMDKDALDNSFLVGCPFSECIIRVENWAQSYSEVNIDLPIFETLTLYSTVYDYDTPSDSDDYWYHDFQPNMPKAISVIEAYAFPDISTKFCAVLHVWWVYIPEKDDYRFFQFDVLLQNKHSYELEPAELFNFAFGINYELRHKNDNFRGLSVGYYTVNDYTMETVMGSLLNIMEKDGLNHSFLSGCPFSECIISVQSCGIIHSHVNQNLPIFETLTLYSTIYDYDGPTGSEDHWHHDFQPDMPKAICVIEAYAFPDISTKFRSLLHVWWLYVPPEDNYRLLQSDVLLQNKNRDNYPSIFL